MYTTCIFIIYVVYISDIKCIPRKFINIDSVFSVKILIIKASEFALIKLYKNEIKNILVFLTYVIYFGFHDTIFCNDLLYFYLIVRRYFMLTKIHNLKLYYLRNVIDAKNNIK